MRYLISVTLILALVACDSAPTGPSPTPSPTSTVPLTVRVVTMAPVPQPIPGAQIRVLGDTPCNGPTNGAGAFACLVTVNEPATITVVAVGFESPVRAAFTPLVDTTWTFQLRPTS